MLILAKKLEIQLENVGTLLSYINPVTAPIYCIKSEITVAAYNFVQVTERSRYIEPPAFSETVMLCRFLLLIFFVSNVSFSSGTTSIIILFQPSNVSCVLPIWGLLLTPEALKNKFYSTCDGEIL